MQSSRAEKIGLKKSLYNGPKNVGSKNLVSFKKCSKGVLLMFLILIAVLVEFSSGSSCIGIVPSCLNCLLYSQWWPDREWEKGDQHQLFRECRCPTSFRYANILLRKEPPYLWPPPLQWSIHKKQIKVTAIITIIITDTIIKLPIIITITSRTITTWIIFGEECKPVRWPEEPRCTCASFSIVAKQQYPRVKNIFAK